jgi:hypothetical protein
VKKSEGRELGFGACPLVADDHHRARLCARACVRLYEARNLVPH